MGITDLTDVAGVPTTYGAVPFADNVADSNAVVVNRLKAAGAIVVGKNQHVRVRLQVHDRQRAVWPNEHDRGGDHVAGGSAGGSAAAMAHGLAAFAQGSDGGGSIRLPAACCGIYGFKPSFGRVPDDGRPDGFGQHTPFVCIGPMSRTVEDAAVAMDVMAGPHLGDPFSVPNDGTVCCGAVGAPSTNSRSPSVPGWTCFRSRNRSARRSRQPCRPSSTQD